jgi:hypothetical protein
MTTKSVMALALTLLGLSLVGTAARCEPVFDPPGERLSIHPLEQRGELYGAARDSAAWHVSQWNNPGGDVADFRDNRASNDGLVVEVDQGTPPHYKIVQNGEQLRCDGNGIPLEFDGFIGTNTKANNPGLPGAEHDGVIAVPLSRLGSLTQQIDLKLNQAALVGSPRCAVSKSLSIVCVVFTNKISKQVFFYQISLYGFNLTTKSFWWTKGRPTVASDSTS